MLCVAEVVERYDISRSALRRKLKANKVPGALRVESDDGDEWRIHPAGLARAGIKIRAIRDASNGETPARDHVRSRLRLALDMARRERELRRSEQLERRRLETAHASTTAELMNLKVELADRSSRLTSAHRQRLTLELERESAHLESLIAQSELRRERRERAAAEQQLHAAAAAALASGREPDLPLTPGTFEYWKARVGWTFAGAVAMLGGIALLLTLFVGGILTDRGPARSSARPATTPERGELDLEETSPELVSLIDPGRTIGTAPMADRERQRAPRDRRDRKREPERRRPDGENPERGGQGPTASPAPAAPTPGALADAGGGAGAGEPTAISVPTKSVEGAVGAVVDEVADTIEDVGDDVAGAAEDAGAGGATDTVEGVVEEADQIVDDMTDAVGGVLP
jgi:hypothetical protein